MEKKENLARACFNIADKKFPGLTHVVSVLMLVNIALIVFSSLGKVVSASGEVVLAGLSTVLVVIIGFGVGYQRVSLWRSTGLELIAILLTAGAIPGTYYVLATVLYGVFGIVTRYKTVAVWCIVFYVLLYLFVRHRGNVAQKRDNPPEASL